MTGERLTLERPLLFHNLDHGKLSNGCPRSRIPDWQMSCLRRGAAFGDIFNDGKIDVVINMHRPHSHTSAQCESRQSPLGGITLIGGPRSPRDAVGATVYLNAGGIRQRGDVISGGSYLSSNDYRLHFGLGEDPRSMLH